MDTTFGGTALANHPAVMDAPHEVMKSVHLLAPISGHCLSTNEQVVKVPPSVVLRSLLTVPMPFVRALGKSVIISYIFLCQWLSKWKGARRTDTLAEMDTLTTVRKNGFLTPRKFSRIWEDSQTPGPGKTLSRRLLNGNASDYPLSRGELKWTVSHYGFCPQRCPWA